MLLQPGQHQRWLLSAQHAHTKLEPMSPKAVPSIYTYQDEESDVDVAIQFFDREEWKQRTASEVGGIASEAGGGSNKD